MAKFSYRSFTFYKPSQLSENEYKGYSKIIESDPDYEINVPGLNFWTEFQDNIGVAGFLLAIGGIPVFIAEYSGIDFFYIGILFLLPLIGMTIQFFIEFMSYLGTNFSKNSFYMKLTKKIGKSTDYQDYLNRTKRMFK